MLVSSTVAYPLRIGENSRNFPKFGSDAQVSSSTNILYQPRSVEAVDCSQTLHDGKGKIFSNPKGGNINLTLSVQNQSEQERKEKWLCEEISGDRLSILIKSPNTSDKIRLMRQNINNNWEKWQLLPENRLETDSHAFEALDLPLPISPPLIPTSFVAHKYITTRSTSRSSSFTPILLPTDTTPTGGRRLLNRIATTSSIPLSANQNVSCKASLSDNRGNIYFNPQFKLSGGTAENPAHVVISVKNAQGEQQPDQKWLCDSIEPLTLIILSPDSSRKIKITRQNQRERNWKNWKFLPSGTTQAPSISQSSGVQGSSTSHPHPTMSIANLISQLPTLRISNPFSSTVSPSISSQASASHIPSQQRTTDLRGCYQNIHDGRGNTFSNPRPNLATGTSRDPAHVLITVIDSQGNTMPEKWFCESIRSDLLETEAKRPNSTERIKLTRSDKKQRRWDNWQLL